MSSTHAAACGFPVALTVSTEAELEGGRAALVDDSQLTFVRLELNPEESDQEIAERVVRVVDTISRCQLV